MSGNTASEFEAIAVKFEVWDDCGGLAAVVEQEDEHAMRVDIKELIGPHQWPLLSAAIQSCIDRMTFAKPEDA